MILCFFIKDDFQGLLRRGYAPIGQSSFETVGSVITISNVIHQAQAVGACTVLVTMQDSRATPRVSSVGETEFNETNIGAPVSSCAGDRSVTSNGRLASVNGKKTRMMPYSKDRLYITAIYFAKLKTGFGAWVIPTPPKLEKKIGHKGGLIITAIVCGSAADHAELFEGDVITAIDGERVNGGKGMELFNSIVHHKLGQTIRLEIWRRGEIKSKLVPIQSIDQ